jgi:hypothetical protein
LGGSHFSLQRVSIDESQRFAILTYCDVGRDDDEVHDLTHANRKTYSDGRCALIGNLMGLSENELISETLAGSQLTFQSDEKHSPALL